MKAKSKFKTALMLFGIGVLFAPVGIGLFLILVAMIVFFQGVFLSLVPSNKV